MFYPPMVGYAVVMIVALALAYGNARESLTRNLAIGIRTRHTLRSDEAWAAGQKASIPYLIAMAAISGAHGVALLMIELSSWTETLGHLLAVSGFVLVVAVALLAWRSANIAAKTSHNVASYDT